MADDRRQPYVAMPQEEPHEPVLEAPRERREPRDSVGRLLRRTREHYGQDLRVVADTLRIRYAYLNAIEQSRYDELPGPTYAVGFVRSYADYLDLDDDEVVRRFKEEVEGLDRGTQLHFPEPVNEGRIPGGAILLVSLVLIAAAYGGWYYLSSQGKGVGELIPRVPERLQAMVSGDGSKEAEPVAEAPTAEAPEPAADETPEEAPEEADETRKAAAEPSTPADDEPATDTAEAQVPESTAAPASDNGSDLEGGVTTAASEPEAESESGATAAGEPPAAPESEAEDAAADGGAATRTAALPQADETSAPAGEAGASAIPEAPQAEEATGGDATGDSAATQRAAAPTAPEAEDAGGIPAAPDSGAGGSTDRVYGAGNDDARIVLRATQDSWVQVRDADDTLLLTRVLRAGDSYRVPDRAGLTLLTGNAGGLTVLVDGEPVPSLGPSGAVRRGVELDPAKLRRGLARAD